MTNQSTFNFGLLIVALLGLTAIFYPIRKQASYYNQCVEHFREVYSERKDKKYSTNKYPVNKNTSSNAPPKENGSFFKRPLKACQ